jgi:hypothetical protein
MSDPIRGGRPETWMPDREALRRVRQRALALWPRLDRRALSRCGDTMCIASQVARRTSLPRETIRLMLRDDERVPG